MSTPAPPADSLAFRACSMLFCVAIACLLGTFSWLFSFILLGAGALASLTFGWGLPAWTAVLGWTEQELLTNPYADIIDPENLTATSAALMMVDRDLTIIDLNDATRALLKANEAAFARAFPGVALDRMIGTSIDVFHKDPSHQRAMLAQH